MSSREDFKWTDEARNLKQGLPPNHKRTLEDEKFKPHEYKKQVLNTPMPIEIVHLKLDRATLPKDGQRISFQTQDEDWHEGYFVSGDDLFWINESEWYLAFDIVSWKAE